MVGSARAPKPHHSIDTSVEDAQFTNDDLFVASDILQPAFREWCSKTGSSTFPNPLNESFTVRRAFKKEVVRISGLALATRNPLPGRLSSQSQVSWSTTPPAALDVVTERVYMDGLFDRFSAKDQQAKLDVLRKLFSEVLAMHAAGIPIVSNSGTISSSVFGDSINKEEALRDAKELQAAPHVMSQASPAVTMTELSPPTNTSTVYPHEPVIASLVVEAESAMPSATTCELSQIVETDNSAASVAVVTSASRSQSHRHSEKAVQQYRNFLRSGFDATWGGYTADVFPRRKPRLVLPLDRDTFIAFVGTGVKPSRPVTPKYWMDRKKGVQSQEQVAMGQLVDFHDLTTKEWQQAVQMVGYLLGAKNPTSAVFARDVAIASRNRENSGFFEASTSAQLQTDRIKCILADCALVLAQRIREVTSVVSREVVDGVCGLSTADGQVFLAREGVSSWGEILQELRLCMVKRTRNHSTDSTVAG